MSLNESAKALPSIFLDTNTIGRRIRLYRNNKHVLLSDAMSQPGTPKQETKLIWYSKEHVETWLDEMKLTGANGMHIYFGEYESEGDTLPHPELAGQLCLLMVLTRQGEAEGTLTNIIYENEPNYTTRLANTTTERSFSTEPLDDPDRDRQFNFGRYCPPFCTTLEEDDIPNNP